MYISPILKQLAALHRLFVYRLVYRLAEVGVTKCVSTYRTTENSPYSISRLLPEIHLATNTNHAGRS